MEIPILGNKKQPQQPQKIKLDPSTLASVTCPECGSIYFETVQTIKVISELQTQSGQKEFAPIPILKCANSKCGKIIERPGEYIGHMPKSSDINVSEGDPQTEE